MTPDRIRGIPHPLPPGERVLWQGAPDRRTLARSAFHARKLAVYFAVVLGLRGVGPAEPSRVPSLVLLGVLGLGVVAFAEWLAWEAARTTVYAITTRRVLMHFGFTLPTTVNIPLPEIAGAMLCPRGHGRGDIALALCGRARLRYVVLWPHARAWHLRPAQPQLRGVENAATVGEILLRAVAAAVPDEVLANGAVPTPRAAGATPAAPVPLAAAS